MWRAHAVSRRRRRQLGIALQGPNATHAVAACFFLGGASPCPSLSFHHGLVLDFPGTLSCPKTRFGVFSSRRRTALRRRGRLLEPAWQPPRRRVRVESNRFFRQVASSLGARRARIHNKKEGSSVLRHAAVCPAKQNAQTMCFRGDRRWRPLIRGGNARATT